MIQTNLKQVKRLTNIPLEFFITSVSNHKVVKKSILKAIEEQGCYGFKNKAQQISNTDWHLSPSFPRPYIEIAGSIIVGHLDMLKDYFGYDAVTLKNYWFQQYGKGDHHSEHTHSSCNFSSIYYVDLGRGTPKTNFVFRGKIYSLDVNEGDILTFPSFLIHFSPENKVSHTKTVISFNSDAVKEPLTTKS